MRVETNLPNTSNLVDGICFAKVAAGVPEDFSDTILKHKAREPRREDAPGRLTRQWEQWEEQGRYLEGLNLRPPPWMISEEIDEEVGARFLKIPGFRRAERSAEELTAADVEIGRARTSAQHVRSIGFSEEAREKIAELERANLAMSAERDQERDRRMELERQLATSKLPPSERIRELEAGLAEANGKIRSLSKDLGDAQKMNQALAERLAAPASEPTPARRGPKPTAKKTKRATRKPSVSEPSGLAAAAGI